MKKSILFLSAFIVAFSIKSQIVEDWTPAAALTDSSSFNSNPVVITLQDNGSDELFMFYEKRQSQMGLNQIWWKKISGPMSEEQMFIGGWPESDYRNPQVLFNGFLIFECNVYGNYDLFGVRFDGSGMIGNTFRLTNTSSDENSFFSSSYYEDLCCWESDGNIIAASAQISQDTLIFENLEILDSANCYDPVCEEGYVAWRKVENNESHLYYSRKAYPLYQWSEPDTIVIINDNTHLSISTTVPEFGGGYNLCWEAADKIYFSNTWGTYIQISSPDIPGIENYYEPTAFNLVQLLEDIPELISFAGQAGSLRDIYIVDNMFSVDILNITENTYINKNPRLFCGMIGWPYYEVVDIWQTEINGYDALYETHAWYLATGGINEDEVPQVDVSPNPVYDSQRVVINSSENVWVNSVQVYSATGKLVLQNKSNGPSLHFEFDLNGNLPGVYFMKIQTSHGETVRKLIKI